MIRDILVYVDFGTNLERRVALLIEERYTGWFGYMNFVKDSSARFLSFYTILI